MDKTPDEIRREIDRETLQPDLDSIETLELLVKKCETAASIEETHNLRLDAHFSRSSHVVKSYHISSYITDGQRQSGAPRNNISQHAASDGTTTAPASKGHQNGKKKPDYKNSKQAHSKSTPTSANKGDKSYSPHVIHTTNTGHRTSECRSFLGKSSADKKKLLVENKRCLKCFETNFSM